MIQTSIIITNKNYAKFLGRCIRSCLNQSMPRNEYEIIVVDEASTDNSKEVMESFKSEIIPIFLTESSGVAHASNEGIKKARGMYVIRVDSDDFINANTLLIMTEILAWNSDIGFVSCDHFRVDEDGEKLGRIELNNIEKLYNQGAGVMFKKTNLEAIGLYDSKLKNREDYALLVKYYETFEGYHIKLPLYRDGFNKKPLYRYILRDKNISEDKENIGKLQ